VERRRQVINTMSTHHNGLSLSKTAVVGVFDSRRRLISSTYKYLNHGPPPTGPIYFFAITPRTLPFVIVVLMSLIVPQVITAAPHCDFKQYTIESRVGY